MEVNFNVWLGGELLDEGEIAARLDELRPRLQGLDGTEGVLTLYNSTDSYEVNNVRDDLVPLIGAFCFDAVPDLAAGKEVRIPLAAYNETVSLKPEGDVVVLSGDSVKADRCPTRPLLEALVDCGERFVALLKSLHAGEADWKGRLDGWDQVVARTRAAMA